MIRLDVFIAFAGKTYEFACDPDAPIRELAEQIAESVRRREGITFHTADGKDRFRLCSVDLQSELCGDHNLVDYGIRNGGRMVLF